jgi:hypothetical protein
VKVTRAFIDLPFIQKRRRRCRHGICDACIGALFFIFFSKGQSSAENFWGNQRAGETRVLGES